MAGRLAAAGFVLMGGQSRRMGQDKALLAIGGQPLALRTAETLRQVAEWVALLGPPERYGHLGLPILADPEPAGRGPLGGIVVALRSTDYDWNLLVACDLPYLETRFLEFLLERAAEARDADAVVPQLRGRWEPLCAAYHRRALPVLERVLGGEDRRITRAFEELRVAIVTDEALARFAFDERILKNMNSPEEYEVAKKVLGR